MDADGKEGSGDFVSRETWRIGVGGAWFSPFPVGEGLAWRAHGAPGFDLITRGVIGIFFGECARRGFLRIMRFFGVRGSIPLAPTLPPYKEEETWLFGGGRTGLLGRRALVGAARCFARGDRVTLFCNGTFHLSTRRWGALGCSTGRC